MAIFIKKQGAIEAKNITVTFKGKRKVMALKNLSFKVSPQEFICILGTSGCGKSTLLNIIAGFLKPTKGKILLDDQFVDGSGAQRGMVFQQYALFPWKTVRGNIEFGLKIKGIDKDERRRIGNRYIKMVGLSEFADSYPKELSGGMMQRAGLARALANNPLVLLMDEPFGSLDAQTRLKMQILLLKIWEEDHKTVIFVTHDIEEAIFLSDRILVLTARPGQIKKQIRVTLPRPRNHNLIFSRSFITLRKKITKLINE